MMPTNDGVDNKVTLPDGKVAWLDAQGVARTRYGWDALKQIARALCSLVSKFAASIREAFGSNELIVVLLLVLEALCPILESTASNLADGDFPPNDDDLKQQLLLALGSIVSEYGGG